MSTERINELHRQGFIEALFGIEPNAEYRQIKDSGVTDNHYVNAYFNGRKDGNTELNSQRFTNRNFLKLRNKFDAVFAEYVSDNYIETTDWSDKDQTNLEASQEVA